MISVAILLVGLHLPLVYYSFRLYHRMSANQSVSDLLASEQLNWLLLAVAPYLIMRMLGIHWNPERARLGEIIRK